jgi:hypothetical protein
MTDYEPDYTDVDDETRYGFCKHCKKETVIVERDVGIGRYEFQGCRGIHRDMQDCCGECGDEI